MAFLVARPNVKAQATSEYLTAKGLTAFAAPLIDIAPNNDPSLIQQLNSSPIDIIILTSTYASKWLCTQVLTIDLTSKIVVCVGSSTAQVIKQRFPQISPIVAHPATSEGVLMLNELTQVTHKTIAIVKGQGGRELIANTLTKRGGNVLNVEVYKRTKNDQLAHNIAFDEAQIQCIIITSVELGEHAIKYFGRKWMQQLHWIVASERIKDYAVKHGIKNISISDGASNEAIATCAKHLVSTGAVNV